jgi:hypothetical protein
MNQYVSYSCVVTEISNGSYENVISEVYGDTCNCYEISAVLCTSAGFHLFIAVAVQITCFSLDLNSYEARVLSNHHQNVLRCVSYRKTTLNKTPNSLLFILLTTQTQLH